ALYSTICLGPSRSHRRRCPGRPLHDILWDSAGQHLLAGSIRSEVPTHCIWPARLLIWTVSTLLPKVGAKFAWLGFFHPSPAPTRGSLCSGSLPTVFHEPQCSPRFGLALRPGSKAHSTFTYFQACATWTSGNSCRIPGADLFGLHLRS